VDANETVKPADEGRRSSEELGLVEELRLLAAWHLPGGPYPGRRQPDKYKVCTTAAAEIERLRAALQSITHFTSATPSLSESGCGRLLAQIEHEALKALGPND
jgi:hypothetical protein